MSIKAVDACKTLKIVLILYIYIYIEREREREKEREQIRGGGSSLVV